MIPSNSLSDSHFQSQPPSEFLGNLLMTLRTMATGRGGLPKQTCATRGGSADSSHLARRGTPRVAYH